MLSNSDFYFVCLAAIIALYCGFKRWLEHKEIMKWGQKPEEKEETEEVDQ